MVLPIKAPLPSGRVFAFNKFNYEFEKRIKSEGHPGASVDYIVKDADVFQVIERLKK